MTAFPPSSPPTCVMSFADDSEPIVAPYAPNTTWCFLTSNSDDLVVSSVKQISLLHIRLFNFLLNIFSQCHFVFITIPASYLVVSFCL